MKNLIIIYSLFTFFFSFTISSEARPLNSEKVPDVLKPWKSWVLYGYEEYECPFLYNDFTKRFCLWPTMLTLELNNKGGQFKQEWKIWTDGWIHLPGSTNHWPQEVYLNGEPALVVDHNGLPSFWVTSGSHVVVGSFYWTEIPQTLTIDPATALISLTVNSKNIEFPDWTDDKKLWLQQGAQAQDKDDTGDKLDIKVYRRIIDNIPLRVITRIHLNVSGKNRDVLLGHALLENFIPLSLHSALPARIEPEGLLRLQVRPGQWTITVTARHKGPVNSLTLKSSEGIWSEEEVWVFESQNHLRLVEIEGVIAIDPQQTTLPEKWRHLPAYLVSPGDTMKMVQKKRGDPEPAPDYLSLNRRIWLDFDGKGYTIEDHIKGTMSQSWRLEVNPPLSLGRVSVDNHDQLITHLKDTKRSGVEVRQGQIDLVADSRLEGNKRKFPIVGWHHDFQEVRAELNLPPGWRLISTTGVDYVPYTWLKKWTLLDLFVILIVSLSFAHLKRWPIGLLALVTLTLIYHEPGAPRWVWLHLLASSALIRIIPKGKLLRTVKLYYYISIASLIIISIPFMVNQVRKGLYPQLEMPWQVMGIQHEEQRQIPMTMDSAVPQEKAPYKRSKLSGALEDKILYEAENLAQRKAVQQYAPDAKIQTGPGLPKWQWKKYNMKWNGPVREHEELSLVLITPRLTMILLFFQVLVLGILILSMFNISLKRDKKTVFSPLKGSAAVFILGLCFFLYILHPTSARADIPSPELLKDFQRRLLEKPKCLPFCASIPYLRIDALPDRLRMTMEIHSYEDAAIPLPGNERHWLPQKITLNGEHAPAVIRTDKGNLSLALSRGIHHISLEGSLDKRQEIQITLPLKPHRVQSTVKGWYIEGIHENGVPDNQLYLRRLSESRQHKSPEIVEGTTLPPFVLVERTLNLGLIWEVETRIRRISPPGAAIALEVPLLDGESITTENIRVENNKALITFSGHEKEKGWRSLFEKREHIELKAPETLSWTESWKLNVSPVWHLDLEGIPVIHHTDSNGQWLPQWLPWPGESVTLTVTRPQAIEGQTVTIDSSTLSVTPGFRASDVNLSLTIRSSQGVQHNIVLPENIELQSVRINGKTQPIGQQNNTVTLPLVPGSQNIDISWRHGEGITRLFKTPSVDVGKSSVNAQINLAMPHSRWVLFTGGPYMGPAVLIWGVLAIIILLSIVLGRIKITPLKTYQWFLLGVGLTQAPIVCAFITVGWFFALAWRKQFDFQKRDKFFDFIQIALTIITLIALISLFYAIKLGLLGHPHMQISGNGSSAYSFKWFLDRTDSELPTAWVFSVPLMVYRILMLLWSLWLSFSLLKWLRWGWNCFSEGGLWKTLELRKKK